MKQNQSELLVLINMLMGRKSMDDESLSMLKEEEP